MGLRKEHIELYTSGVELTTTNVSQLLLPLTSATASLDKASTNFGAPLRTCFACASNQLTLTCCRAAEMDSLDKCPHNSE